MISSPAAIGGALSGRKPVQSATHWGASHRNDGAERVRQGRSGDCRHRYVAIDRGCDRAPSAIPLSSFESAAHHRQLMRIGADRFEIIVHRQQHVGGAGERRPRPSLTASTHQRCQRKLWRRRVPKSESRSPASFRAARPWSTSWPWRGHRGRRAQTALSLVTWRERSSLRMARAGISHIVVWVQGPWKCSSYWPSTLRNSYSGSWNGEPVEEFRREHLGRAVNLLPASQIISFLVILMVRA